jgi:hypothetical protein
VKLLVGSIASPPPPIYWRKGKFCNPWEEVTSALKAKSRKPSLEWFKIKVTATSVTVAHRGPGLSPLDPVGAADSDIEIEGTLDRPVLDHGTALLCVFCGAEIGDPPGSAIGVTIAWQLVLYLPREQFADLLTTIAARQLVEVDLTARAQCGQRASKPNPCHVSGTRILTTHEGLCTDPNSPASKL